MVSCFRLEVPETFLRPKCTTSQNAFFPLLFIFRHLVHDFPDYTELPTTSARLSLNICCLFPFQLLSETFHPYFNDRSPPSCDLNSRNPAPSQILPSTLLRRRWVVSTNAVLRRWGDKAFPKPEMTNLWNCDHNGTPGLNLRFWRWNWTCSVVICTNRWRTRGCW